MSGSARAARWAVGLVGAVMMATAAAADATVTTIPADQLDGLLNKGVTVVDVRRPDEWRSTGVVAGSRLITAFDAQGRPNPSFVAAVKEAAGKDEPIALICRTGNRSGIAATELIERAGFSRVYNVAGGITAWMSAGKPVQSCPSC